MGETAGIPPSPETVKVWRLFTCSPSVKMLPNNGGRRLKITHKEHLVCTGNNRPLVWQTVKEAAKAQAAASASGSAAASASVSESSTSNTPSK